MLFGMIKRGMAPFAWKGYESDMPAFGAILSDDAIWSVLAYIKSTWPELVRATQADVSAKARGRAAARPAPKGNE
jgi:mono/diheme cytochrome c family protein